MLVGNRNLYLCCVPSFNWTPVVMVVALGSQRNDVAVKQRAVAAHYFAHIHDKELVKDRAVIML